MNAPLSPAELTVAQALAEVAAGRAAFVDVREPDEFAAGHIATALSLPRGAETRSMPAGVTPIFVCQSGMRAGAACASVPGAVRLKGGMVAWRDAGQPVIGKAPGLSIMRQVQMIVGLLVLLGVLAGFAGHVAGYYVAAFFGAALLFAGATGWCGLALLLARMPWNR